MNQEGEKLFRQYERALDVHHRSLDLWSADRPEAIYSVLTIPDAMMLVPLLVPEPPVITDGLAQQLQGMEDGVTQALRWLCAEEPIVVRSTAVNELIDSAHEFAHFADNYANIADFHMMRGRGTADAEIDSATKTVTFRPVAGPGLSDTLAWHEQVRYQANRGLDLAMGMKPSDTRAAMQVLERLGYDLLGGRVVLHRLPDDLVASLGTTLLQTRELESIPMPPGADLIGFTIEEFWQFIGAVTAWSQAAVMRYFRCALSRVPQCECMPTQIIDEPTFVEQIARLAALDAAKVVAVLDRLAYHPSPKADIRLSPFLRGNGMVSWSPATIAKMRHERNLLKVMSRGPKSMHDRAATLNGARDRPLGRRIGGEFSKRGYQFKLMVPIAAGAEGTDIDVLLWFTGSPDEVLIIEAKALVAPDEINEVNEAAGVMLRAQEQVRRAMRILTAMPIAEKNRRFPFVPWDRIRHYCGVVVTSDAEPHELVDPNEIPVISLNNLCSRFHRRDFRSPRRFWQACVERPWLANEIQERELQYMDILVGEIT